MYLAGPLWIPATVLNGPPCINKVLPYLPTYQILRCDWLPERARWSYLARSGLTAVSRKKIFAESHIINPLLTKLVWSRWLDIGLVLFLRVYAKKELGQYPAILTSHLVNNPYLKLSRIAPITLADNQRQFENVLHFLIV